MGIDTKAAIFVGRLRGEMPEELPNGTETSDAIDDGDLEVCSPYYDGNSDDGAVVGFDFARTPSHGASELEWDQGRIDELKREFKELTGLDAKVYVSPHVT